MPRAARNLYIAALILVALGAGFLLYAKQVQRAYRELETIWTPADGPAPVHFRVAAFPAGVEGRGVPDRAILVPLADWLDPVGVVHWGEGDNMVAVQRRLLRIDLPPDAAAPLIGNLNDALARSAGEDREAEYTLGQRLSHRRLTVLRSDNLREAFDYAVSDTGEITPIAALAAGDKAALIRAGLWALLGVVLAWTAALVALAGAILHARARRKLA